MNCARRAGSGRLERAPVDVVAEIAPGIARQPRAARGSRAPRASRRANGARPRSARLAAARSRARPADSRSHRETGSTSHCARASRCARTACGRKAEHQHDVGLVLRDQLRQVAIDRRVAGLEDVHDAPHIGERRPPPLRDRARERPARIERRAGKAAEAGDEDVVIVTRPSAPRSRRPRAPATACRPRPPARSPAARALSFASVFSAQVEAILQHRPHPFHLLLAPPRREFARRR